MTENVFLLCCEDDLQTLMNGFCEYFGVDPSGAENSLRLKNGSIEMNISVVTQQTNEKFMKEQKEAVWQHFQAVRAEDNTLKLNVLQQINFFRGFIAITYSYGSDEDKSMVVGALREMFSPLHALVLADDGSALLNTDFQVVFDDHGMSQVGSFMPFDCAAPLGGGSLTSVESRRMEQRRKSLTRLDAKNIFALRELPLTRSREDCAVKTLEEIAGRAVCLLVTALYAECLVKGSEKEALTLIRNVVERFMCDRYFSPREMEFLQKASQDDIIHFSWQYENVLVLEWILGLVDKMDFPGRLCSVPEVFGVMNRFDSLGELVRAARLRELDEILDELDFTYCLDWACVEARVNGLKAPTGAEPGVVMERHRALRWMVCREEWDAVDIST